MEALNLKQEPLEPAPIEARVRLERAGLVDLVVLGELRTLNQSCAGQLGVTAASSAAHRK